MTAPERARKAAMKEAAAGAEAATKIVQVIADRLGGKASVTAVFGQPVTSGEVTVIPVARVGFGFGAGAGRDVDAAKGGDGGGGGGGGGARPVGFIEIANGRAVYRPIRDKWTDVLVPVAGLLATAAVRAIGKFRRR